ncbi:hypothetical protein PENTCL1PPCAC_27779, partial [Pristionchus entomophagus]
IRYNVIKMVDDKRPVHRLNNPEFDHWWSYDNTLRDKERDRRSLVWRELRDLSKDDVVDDEIETESLDDVDAPTRATLLDCVVSKRNIKRSRKHPIKRRFVDETCRVKGDPIEKMEM